MCIDLQTALSKLPVEPLQLRFDALPQAGTHRLNTIKYTAGLITYKN